MALVMDTDYALSSLYAFNETTGTIDPADYSEVESFVNSDLCAALDIDTKIETSTPAGRFLEWLSLFFTRTLGLNVQNANQLLISAAAGQQLDAIAQWFQLKRFASSYSTVTVKCYRANGYEGDVIIPIGSLVRNQRGNIFESIAEGVIKEGDDSALIEFEAMETGAIDVTQNAVNIVDSSIYGWGSCNNPSAGTPGSEIETDESLRERIKAARTTATGFLGAIKNAVESVVGNGSVMVLENSTSADLDVHGVSMKQHSILVCVDGLPMPLSEGAEDNAEIKAVAQAIFNNKPCGTGYTYFTSSSVITNSDGTISSENPMDFQYDVTVNDPFGNPYHVFFCAPIPQPITVAILVKNRNYTGADIIGDTTTAVNEWATESAFKCGEDVYASDVIKSVEEKVPGVVVVTCTVSEGGEDKGTSFAEIDAIHKASVDKINVQQYTR